MTTEEMRKLIQHNAENVIKIDSPVDKTPPRKIVRASIVESIINGQNEPFKAHSDDLVVFKENKLIPNICCF